MQSGSIADVASRQVISTRKKGPDDTNAPDKTTRCQSDVKVTLVDNPVFQATRLFVDRRIAVAPPVDGFFDVYRK
jgi:hypothetical protein